MISAFLVTSGGFFGAIFRYIISKWIKDTSKLTIPVGTLTVNLVGSFFLGFLYARGSGTEFYTLFGVGFLGAFTTFSTLNVEAVLLFHQKKHTISIIYLLITYIVGISMALLGYYIYK